MSIRMTTTGRGTRVVIPNGMLCQVRVLNVLLYRQRPLLIANRLMRVPSVAKRRTKAPVISECVSGIPVLVGNAKVGSFAKFFSGIYLGYLLDRDVVGIFLSGITFDLLLPYTAYRCGRKSSRYDRSYFRGGKFVCWRFVVFPTTGMRRICEFSPPGWFGW